MPGLPLPLPQPIPIPWPDPRPGVGTPLPIPQPSPGIPIPSPFPAPILTSPSGGGSLTGPFADLFKFKPDWKFWLALVVVAGSVELVDQTYPEYVWIYVGILLLGFIIMSAGFTPNLDRLLKGT